MKTSQNIWALKLDFSLWQFILISLLLLICETAFGMPDHTCHITSEEDICLGEGSVTLVAPTNAPVVCANNSVSITVGKSIIQNHTRHTVHYDNGCPDEVTDAYADPSYTITWIAWIGTQVISGTSATATFTPTNCAKGSVIFNVDWTNAAPCHGTGHNSASADFYAVKPTSTNLSVSATAVGSNGDYVAIKTTNQNDYVYVSVNVCPAYTNAAALITWTGGEAVPGNPFSRRVPKNVSAKTTVSASLCGFSATAKVWVIWGTVSYNFNGPLDANDGLSFGNWGVGTPLIAQFPNPRNAGSYIGQYTAIVGGNSKTVVGAHTKVEIIGTLSPPGVGSIFASSSPFSLNPQTITYYVWSASRTRYGPQLPNVTSSTTGTLHGHENDSPLPEQTTPVNDKLFALDPPGTAELFAFNLTGYEALAVNFTNYIRMNGVIISDPNTWNSHTKATFLGGTITASPCSAGAGNPPLPTTWGSSNW